MCKVHVLGRVLYTRASTCVYARARIQWENLRPGQIIKTSEFSRILHLAGQRPNKKKYSMLKPFIAQRCRKVLGENVSVPSCFVDSEQI